MELFNLMPKMKFVSEFVFYLVPLIFMLCDIVSGLAKAYVQKNSGDVVSNLKYMDGVTITNS